MDLEEYFDLKKNEERKRWEFTPNKKVNSTSYSVAFNEAENEQDAWITLFLDIKKYANLKIISHQQSTDKIFANNGAFLKQSELEIHVCKYCGAETTQSDDTCYAKSENIDENGKPKTFLGGLNESNKEPNKKKSPVEFLIEEMFENQIIFSDKIIHQAFEMERENQNKFNKMLVMLKDILYSVENSNIDLNAMSIEEIRQVINL